MVRGLVGTRRDSFTRFGRMLCEGETMSLEDPYSEQQALFEACWLPYKPLCAPAKDAPYRHLAREVALDYPYIEANPLCVKSLIVTDVDTASVQGLASEAGLPPESYTVITRGEIGSGHIGYILKKPVALTDAARRRPVNLLARIEYGICDVLGGDIGYSGRITKNPVNPPEFCVTDWGDGEVPTYTLIELAIALNLLHALPRWDDPAPRKTSGVGRNVDIFDRTRHWAYRAIKRYWSDGLDAWGEAVHAKATYLNLDLEREGRQPLPDREIYHLARSITRWTWQRFDAAQFAAIQQARGHKSGIARQAKRDQKLETLQ